MGKRLLTGLLLLLGAVTASAVPAWPGKFVYTQPDGTVVILQRHGDEHFNWTTDASGRKVKLSESGFWEEESFTEHLIRKQRALTVRPRAVWATYEDHPVTNHGDRKVLCLLANFTDSTFVIDNPRSQFSRMLNEKGYSDFGAIGSVRDYYMDNSLGDYRPEFDVYGPVTLSESSDYYDKHGVGKAILEAYDLLSDQINLSDYDTDGDGDVDMVLFYYPGHNEAEGGGEESIWPHQSNGRFGTRDGIVFNRYFCTSELRGRRGTQMCGIGTTCHEFAHALGLPDFYDTDYEENGSNDDPTGKFDLMDMGNYNDSGRRPPYLSALERNMLGWMENMSELPAGPVSLRSVRTNAGYVVPGMMEGEYFVLECRDNYKWDSALSDYGLLIYHIDKSSRTISERYTGAGIWNTDAINSIGGHPCYYLKKAGTSHYAFPGKTSVTSFIVKDWDEEPVHLLNGITFDGETVSFRARGASSTILYGTVQSSSGTPLSGARVGLQKSAYPFPAPSLRAVDEAVVTEDDGYYEFVLEKGASKEQILSVQCDGYTPLAMNVSLDSPFENRDLILPRIGEGDHSSLRRYDPTKTLSYINFGDEEIALSMRYSKEEIQALGIGGNLIESISFLASASSFEKAYVIITEGEEKRLLLDISDRFVSGSMTKIDVSTEGITVPTDGDLYIGFGLSGVSVSKGTVVYIYMDGEENEWADGMYRSWDYLDEGMTWNRVDLGFYYSFVISAEVSQSRQTFLSDFGVASIQESGNAFVAVPPSGKTVYRIEWFLDGKPVETPPTPSSLPSGLHTVMARFTYYDGSADRVFLEMNVK